MQFDFNKNNILEEQTGYAKRVLGLVNNIYGDVPKACVITFGCQQNVSDSERLKGMLFEMGYTIVDTIDNADFIIFNTFMSL